MPRGTGHGVARGVSRGVKAFMDSYGQAKHYEQQEKMQKHSFIVETLMRQINDPNTPYYERARMIDSIPPLLDIKLERRLSEQIGYDKLNERDFEIEPGAPQIASKQGTTAQYSPEVSPEGAAITLKGTEATPEVPALAAKTEKYGNLSPAQIKLHQDLRAAREQNVNDIDKQAQILAINYKLQADILGKNGFDKEIFRGYDDNGNFKVTLANSAGEKKDINLGPVTSEAVRRAQISANRATGRSGQIMQALQIIEARQMGQNIPDWQYEGARKIIDHFDKTGQLLEAKTESLQQGLEGTKPTTEQQDINNAQENQRTLVVLETNRDNLEGELEAATEAAESAKDEANEFYNVNIQPLKNEMKKWIDDGGNTTDKEYIALNRRLEDFNSQHATKLNQMNRANTKLTNVKTRFNKADSRFRNFKPITSRATTSGGQNSSSPVDSEIGQYKSKIDAFRTDPKNKGKVETLTDGQILQILKNANKL
jgi:hypothetical protein